MCKIRSISLEINHKKTPTPETDVGVSLLNPHNFETKLTKHLNLATDF